MFLSIEQIKAARALLSWTQKDLAKQSGLKDDQVYSFEAGRTRSLDVLEKIYNCFLDQGLEFTDGQGVRFKSLKTKTFRRREGFVTFMNLVYETARTQGGEFCISNVDESVFTERMGQEADDEYTLRMKALKSDSTTPIFSFRILIKEGDDNVVASDYATYRSVPDSQFFSIPFYVFGNNLAFLIFNEQTTIHVIDNKEIADAQRAQFNMIWREASPVNA